MVRKKSPDVKAPLSAAGTIFALVALLHLTVIFYNQYIHIAGWLLPRIVQVPVVLVIIGMSIWMFLTASEQ